MMHIAEQHLHKNLALSFTQFMVNFDISSLSKHPFEWERSHQQINCAVDSDLVNCPHKSNFQGQLEIYTGKIPTFSKYRQQNSFCENVYSAISLQYGQSNVLHHDHIWVAGSIWRRNRLSSFRNMQRIGESSNIVGINQRFRINATFLYWSP